MLYIHVFQAGMAFCLSYLLYSHNIDRKPCFALKIQKKKPAAIAGKDTNLGLYRDVCSLLLNMRHLKHLIPVSTDILNISILSKSLLS